MLIIFKNDERILPCSELEQYISASVLLSLSELRAGLHVWSGTSVKLEVQLQIHDEKNDSITRYFPERVTSRSKTLSVCEKPTYGEFNNHSQVFKTQWETFINVGLQI